MTDQAENLSVPVPDKTREARAIAIGVAGWVVPGLGHALQKMWARALNVFYCGGSAGHRRRGHARQFIRLRGWRRVRRAGLFRDLGTGSFYWLAKYIEVGGSDVSHAYGDYGTRFLAAAGVLNLLAALHAYEAARGRKA